MYYSPSRKALFAEPFGDDSVEISAQLHDALLAKLNQGYTLESGENGQPVAVAPPEPEPVVETVDQVFQNRLATMNHDYEIAGKALRGSYPTTETSTWPQQIDQARAYDLWRKAGREGEPPEMEFVNDLSARRTIHQVGNGLDDLVDRILANNTVYSPAIAELTARRHAGEQALRVAQYYQSIEQLKAVTWNFDLTQFLMELGNPTVTKTTAQES